MDTGRIIEICILVGVQLAGIVAYNVWTRVTLNNVLMRLEQFEEHHKKHYEHAEKDAEKFGEIGKQLGVLVEQNKHVESDLVIMRQSFHEIRNAMSVVLGKAALMAMTKPKPDDGL